MSHGSQCDCIGCKLGKKMGIIKEPEHIEQGEVQGVSQQNEVQEAHDSNSHAQEGQLTCETCKLPLMKDGNCVQCTISKE